MNAAPTAFFIYGASYYPTEMLCIPMGLRICRPETGLVHASEKMNGIHGISSGLCPRPSEAKEQDIEIWLILRGLCTKFIQSGDLNLKNSAKRCEAQQPIQKEE